MKQDAVSPTANDGAATTITDRRASFAFPGLVLAGGALLCATLTLFILLGLTPIEPTSHVVITSVVINSFFVLGLIALIGREVARLLKARSRGRAAARLHIRIVVLFSIVAITPAILVAIFASITLNVGLDRWFSIQNAVDRQFLAECRAGLHAGERELPSGSDRLHGERPGA